MYTGSLSERLSRTRADSPPPPPLPLLVLAPLPGRSAGGRTGEVQQSLAICVVEWGQITVVIVIYLRIGTHICQCGFVNYNAKYNFANL